MKKISSVIFNVLIWLVIIASSIFVYGTLSSKKNGGVPKFFGYSPLVILSDSMNGDGAQNFKTGDLIFIKDTDTTQLEERDIVTFPDIVDGKKALVTHRIIKIENEGSIPRFTTQGDNNLIPDDIVKTPNDIIGIYAFQIKNAGKIMNFFSSKWGFFFCIVLPLLLFFIWRLIKLVIAVMNYKRVKEKEQEEGKKTVDVKSAESAELQAEDEKPAESEPAQEVTEEDNPNKQN